jgi:predicted dehydrogenase
MATLRWGILGTASIAQDIHRAIEDSEHDEVRAVASRSLDTAQAWAKQHGVPEAYGSYQALLESGSVDVVYIPLPNAIHGQWTLHALEAGLPVLCEKPLTTSLADAREIQAAAERTGLPVVEAFMYRYHPLFATVQELIADGIIGTVRTITSRFTFVEEDRGSIVMSETLGGGALLDVGCYCVHLSRMLAGAEPRRVAALATAGSVDDVFMGLLEFTSGVLAQFEASIVTTERHGAEIHGSTGTIRIPAPWLPGRAPASFVVERWGHKDELHTVSGADTYALEVADLSQAVRTGRAPAWPVADGVANMAVIDALIRAARSSAAWVVLRDGETSAPHG